MAEGASGGGDDPVLEIRVVGNFEDFDEGIRRREASAPRQHQLSGPATFGTERGIRESPALSTTSQILADYARGISVLQGAHPSWAAGGGIPTFPGMIASGSLQPWSPQMPVPWFGQNAAVHGHASSDGGTSLPRLERAADQLTDVMLRAAARLGQLGEGVQFDTFRNDEPSVRRGRFGSPSSPERGLVRRRDLATRRAIRPASLEGEWVDDGFGEEDFFEGEASSVSPAGLLPGPGAGGGGDAATATINIPNGVAAGGAGGMVPPFGPQNGGRRGGGGPPWQNFPPYPFRFPGRRPRGGIPWWRRNIARGGMFYTTMFGLFEVGRSLEASYEGETAAEIAQDPMELLRSQVNTIHQETGGILGGISGLGFNVLAGGGWNIDSPYKLNRDLKIEEARYRGLAQSGEAVRGVMAARTLRTAIPQGETAAAHARDTAQAGIQERQWTEQIGFLNSQLNATVRTFHLFDPTNPLRSGYTNDPVISDPGLQSEYATRIRTMRLQIQNSRQQLAFNDSERRKDLAATGEQLSIRGYDAMDAATLSPRDAAAASLVRAQHEEYQQARRFNPELLPRLDVAQGQERRALELTSGRAEQAMDIQSRTNVYAAGLEADRRPYEAQRARLLGGYSASAAANANNQPEVARLTQELIANLTTLKTNKEFGEQGALIGLIGQNTVASYMLDRNPLSARLAQNKIDYDMAMHSLPKDADPELANNLGYLKERRDTLTNQEYQDESDRIGLGLLSHGRVLEAAFNRDPAGAAAAGILGGAESTALQLHQAGRDREASVVASQGVRELGLYRRNYLESFRGEQVDLYSNRIDNVRDRENPASTIQTIDKAITELNELLSGKSSTFYDNLKQAIGDLIAGGN